MTNAFYNSRYEVGNGITELKLDDGAIPVNRRPAVNADEYVNWESGELIELCYCESRYGCRSNYEELAGDVGMQAFPTLHGIDRYCQSVQSLCMAVDRSSLFDSISDSCIFAIYGHVCF